MAESTPPTEGEPGALLRPKEAERIVDIGRVPAAPDLADVVDYVWRVRWHAPEPYTPSVVHQPKVHLAAENGRLNAYGVTSAPFGRTLRGDGIVVGVAFTPAGFRPVLGRSVADIADAVTPIGDLRSLPRPDADVAAEVLAPDLDDAERAAIVTDFLRALTPEPDPLVRTVNGWVRLIEQTPDLRRVDDLAAAVDEPVRRVQRLFASYVGATPKAVIARRRILDIAALIHSGGAPDWATLAVDLGFSDQAHLIRAFGAVVGAPPARYAREAARGRQG